MGKAARKPLEQELWEVSLASELEEARGRIAELETEVTRAKEARDLAQELQEKAEASAQEWREEAQDGVDRDEYESAQDAIEGVLKEVRDLLYRAKYQPKLVPTHEELLSSLQFVETELDRVAR